MDFRMHYNSSLKSRAKELRKQMTKAEASLWKYTLKARKMKGYSFRRQRPIGNYIVDFLCKELMLIIEVDGITHTWEEVNRKDLIRQNFLEALGFTVLRFDDEEILNNLDEVEEQIAYWIEFFEKGKGG